MAHGPAAVGAIVPMGLVATGAAGAAGSAADSGKRLDARPEPLVFGKEEACTCDARGQHGVAAGTLSPSQPTVDGTSSILVEMKGS